MDTQKLKDVFSSTYRQYLRVLAIVVLGMLVGACVVFFLLPKPVIEAPNLPVIAQNIVATSSFARSAPTHIIIPKIALNTTFVPPLGLNVNKTVSVPDNYTQVGWYSGGATPGEIGPAVILGHVDSYQGSAVFYKLGQLKVGDEIYITREDKSTTTFEVTDIGRYSQDAFPTLLVYGPIDFAGLRLVTCTGIYNHGTKKYSHNLVVYAKLKK